MQIDFPCLNAGKNVQRTLRNVLCVNVTAIDHMYLLKKRRIVLRYIQRYMKRLHSCMWSRKQLYNSYLYNVCEMKNDVGGKL